jgi:hypothetical protein
MLNKILAELKIEDFSFSEDLRWIAEDCGLAAATALLLCFGKGITLYIPGFDEDKLPDVQAENLPNDDMKLVAEKCGIEIARSLIEKFSQTAVYVPRIETTAWAKEYIRSHYTHKNAKRLAQAFGVSDRFIYKCIKGNKVRA